MPAKQLTIKEFFGSKGKELPDHKQLKRKRSESSAPSPPILYKKSSSVYQNDRKETEAGKNDRKETESSGTVPLLDGNSDDVFTFLTEPSWLSLLGPELKKDYIKNISYFLKCEYDKGKTIFPPKNLIFNAFNLTPFHSIRVVLIGQDPYHNWSQAHGLCFSVPTGVPFPPSLKNIFKQLSSDYPQFKVPEHGSLESWARQGVFMLNATMTVEAHKANSHSHIGWQKFTDEVIKLINLKSDKGIVFMLWGEFAQCKEKYVDKRKHRVVKAAHPSPLSAYKFFGCKCFTKTNTLLKELGREPINWTLVSSPNKNCGKD